MLTLPRAIAQADRWPSCAVRTDRAYRIRLMRAKEYISKNLRTTRRFFVFVIHELWEEVRRIGVRSVPTIAIAPEIRDGRTGGAYARRVIGECERTKCRR